MDQLEYNELTQQLVHKIYFSDSRLVNALDVVVAIRWGGIRIGAAIAKAFKLPLRQVHISHYHTDTPIINSVDYSPLEFSFPLLVDDLTDDGTTLQLFRENFGPPALTAVLLHSANSKMPVDFYAAPKPNKWVVFPWENENERT